VLYIFVLTCALVANVCVDYKPSMGLGLLYIGEGYMLLFGVESVQGLKY
jgi:hypothetical protein